MDISAEGELKLDNLDLYGESLKQKAVAFEPGTLLFAIAKRFDVTVADGTLNLDFIGVAGEAIVSAVVAIPNDIPPAMVPYSGLGDYATSPFREAIRTAWSVHSQSNLRRIGQSLLIYGNEHRGKYPPDFQTVVLQRYGDDLTPFANPRVPTLLPRGEMSWLEAGAWVDVQHDYLLAPGVAGASYTKFDDKSIIAYENPDTTPFDDLNVLWGDGHVSNVTRAAVVGLFGGSPAAPPEPQRPLQTAGDVKVIDSQHNLRDLADALRIYSNENRGRMPLTPGLLFGHVNGMTPQTFLNPRFNSPPPPASPSDDQTRAWIDAQTDYVYLGAGRRDYDTPVIAYENPAEAALGINLLFGDGHVEFREMRWALETIATAKAYITANP
jgi:prepilin-type processing-associated H-X9-DG protein